MAITKPIYTKLPNGKYWNAASGQTVDPGIYTPDQLENMGIPRDAGTPAPQVTSQSQSPAFQQPQVQPQPQPNGQTLGTSRQAQTEWEKLVDKIYGQTPTQYEGAYNTAYTNMGQPGGNAGNYGNKTIEGTQALADAYADRVYQKTGQLPSEDEVRQFVAKNLDAHFAASTIQGTSKDQIIANYVDPYIQANQSQNSSQDLSGVNTLQELQKQMPGLYQQASNQLGDVADTAFAAPRKAAIEDEAALGRLRSPASINNIGLVDAAKAQSLAQGRANLGLSQLTNTTDLGKALAGVQEQQQGINNQASQFGQTYGLQSKQLAANLYNQDYQQGLQNRQLDLAAQLGRQQADASKPGWMDYLNTGLSAAGTVAGIATMNPWRTASSAASLVGGLSKKKTANSQFGGNDAFA